MSKLTVAYRRGVPACAFGYNRSLAHLRSWRPEVPSAVKEAVVSVSTARQHEPVSPHSGSWLFLYEHIPQLKYHYPEVKVNVIHQKEANSTIRLTLGNGDVIGITTTGLRQRDIKKKFETLLSSLTAV